MNLSILVAGIELAIVIVDIAILIAIKKKGDNE